MRDERQHLLAIRVPELLGALDQAIERLGQLGVRGARGGDQRRGHRGVEPVERRAVETLAPGIGEQERELLGPEEAIGADETGGDEEGGIPSRRSTGSACAWLSAQPSSKVIAQRSGSSLSVITSASGTIAKSRSEKSELALEAGRRDHDARLRVIEAGLRGSTRW